MIECHDFSQLSQDWVHAKLGLPSPSGFDRILTPTCKLSGQRDDYLWELVAESVLDKPVRDFSTYWTERGLEIEGEALDYYTLQRDTEPRTVGLVYRDDSKMVCCSPDFLVDDDPEGPGTGEMKAPKASTHMRYLRGDEVPKAYLQQTQGALWVTGRNWIDFLSYFPGLPPCLVRAYPEDKWQQALDAEIPAFVDELLAARAWFTETYGARAA